MRNVVWIRYWQFDTQLKQFLPGRSLACGMAQAGNVWSSFFPVRNLRAFTLYPLIVFPQRYTHEEGYVSDTEDSPVVAEEVVDKKPAKEEL
ncbi:hypothetical protein ANCDUO_26773 [Ancylostoma duodenale]|uniref:Uncharacterized protein n=1 Tax=Ancylostoma duodenale TaxID=51022 RepID=A0A0C2FDU9_9BILA|nr:hypothetical protein ANCDUO_26773 [Ancylostoma duodenale]